MNRARRSIITWRLQARLPFGEGGAREAILSQCFSGRRVSRSSRRAGVILVYPSSDKVVNTPSLYGATKRLEEAMYVPWQPTGICKRSRLLRNILGTSGSVVETVAKQDVTERRSLLPTKDGRLNMDGDGGQGTPSSS